MLKLKKIKNRTFKADFGITLNKAEIVKSLDYTLFRSASFSRNCMCEKKGIRKKFQIAMYCSLLLLLAPRYSQIVPDSQIYFQIVPDNPR